MTRHTNSKPTDERRDHSGFWQKSSTVGRTIGIIVCPFCRNEVECYLWSLAGSGKRCSCGALLTTTSAFKAVQL